MMKMIRLFFLFFPAFLFSVGVSDIVDGSKCTAFTCENSVSPSGQITSFAVFSASSDSNVNNQYDTINSYGASSSGICGEVYYYCDQSTVSSNRFDYCSYSDTSYSLGACALTNTDGSCSENYIVQNVDSFVASCTMSGISNQVFENGQLRDVTSSDCPSEFYFDPRSELDSYGCWQHDCPTGQIPDDDYYLTALCHDAPTTATDPVDTTDPTTATDPVDTTDPTTATDPVDTTDPTTATDPVDTTDPTTAADPVDTTDPMATGDTSTDTNNINFIPPPVVPIDFSGNTDLNEDVRDTGDALHSDLLKINQTNQVGFNTLHGDITETNDILKDMRDMNKDESSSDSSYLDAYSSFYDDILTSVQNVENSYNDVKATITGDYLVTFPVSSNCTIHFNVFSRNVSVNMCQWASILRPYFVFSLTVYFLLLLIRLHFYLYSIVNRSNSD